MRKAYSKVSWPIIISDPNGDDQYIPDLAGLHHMYFNMKGDIDKAEFKYRTMLDANLRIIKTRDAMTGLRDEAMKLLNEAKTCQDKLRTELEHATNEVAILRHGIADRDTDIRGLEADIEDYKVRVDDYEDEITTLRREVMNCNEEIGQLHTDITAYQSAQTAFKYRMNSMYGKMDLRSRYPESTLLGATASPQTQITNLSYEVHRLNDRVRSLKAVNKEQQETITKHRSTIKQLNGSIHNLQTSLYGTTWFTVKEKQETVTKLRQDVKDLNEIILTMSEEKGNDKTRIEQLNKVIDQLQVKLAASK